MPKKIFKTIVVVIVIVTIFVLLQKGAIQLERYMDKNISSLICDIPKDCFVVLNIDSNYIGNSKTVFSDNEPVISSFEYEDKITVTVFKLHVVKDALYNIVDCDSDLTNLGIDGGVFYSGIENSLVKINYTPTYGSITAESVGIHFSRSNHPKRIMENDSTCAYFIPNSFGFKVEFNDRKHHDISVEVKPRSVFEKFEGKAHSLPDMLLLLKRQRDALYIFVIHKKDITIEEINEKSLMFLLNIKNK